MDSKDLKKPIVKEQFYLLGKVVDNANAARNSYSQAKAKIDALSKDYSPEYLAASKGKAADEYKAKKQALYNDAKKQLEKLKTVLVELNSPLDLTDPAFQTALDLIKNVGPDLGVENILNINASVAGNQSALKVLQAAYKAAGAAYDGGLGEQIYNIFEAVQALDQRAEEALLQDGSIFKFGVAVGKIATLEHVDFPQGNPFPSMAADPAARDANWAADTARAAAGLTPTE